MQLHLARLGHAWDRNLRQAAHLKVKAAELEEPSLQWVAILVRHDDRRVLVGQQPISAQQARK